MQNKNPTERAIELHNLIEDDRKRRNTTTAVGNTNSTLTIIGTNDEYMRLEIKKALLDHEIVAKSTPGKHAEENIIAEATSKDLKILEIGASRPICLDCEELINELGLETTTGFSGKKSKNRRL